MTLATCEAIFDAKQISPEKIANRFLVWFNKRRFTGLGSSTLQALSGLQVGGHWALVGRTGEYGAGNGAAMRIAPLAFKSSVKRVDVQDVSMITHKNDEAYMGALSIYKSLVRCIKNDWNSNGGLIEPLIEELPDTRIRDRFIELNRIKEKSIEDCGKAFQPTGYVVDAVPFSVFCAEKIFRQDFKEIVINQIKVGGDTDTVCSMTGQLLGSRFGKDVVPEKWILKAKNLDLYPLILDMAAKWKY